MPYTADRIYDSVQNMDHGRSLTPGALVDFGLTATDAGSKEEAQRRLEALYACVESGEISQEQLRAMSGNGPAITEVVNSCKSNPYPGIVYTTAYDDMVEEPVRERCRGCTQLGGCLYENEDEDNDCPGPYPKEKA